MEQKNRIKLQNPVGWPREAGIIGVCRAPWSTLTVRGESPTVGLKLVPNPR